MKRRSVLAAAGLAVPLIAQGPRLGIAQTYPDRPIRIVVSYAPGGATDTGARALGERLENILGQPIVVGNKAGGGTIIGTETVAKAKADGYTLLRATGALAVNAAFDMSLPYDTYKDLTPVGQSRANCAGSRSPPPSARSCCPTCRRSSRRGSLAGKAPSSTAWWRPPLRRPMRSQDSPAQ